MIMFRLTSFIVLICIVPSVFAQSLASCGVVLDMQSRPMKGDPDNFYISLKSKYATVTDPCYAHPSHPPCSILTTRGYYRTTGHTGTRNPSFQSAKYAPKQIGFYQDISPTNHAIPKVGDTCLVKFNAMEGGFDLGGVAQGRQWYGIVSLICAPPRGLPLC